MEYYDLIEQLSYLCSINEIVEYKYILNYIYKILDILSVSNVEVYLSDENMIARTYGKDCLTLNYNMMLSLAFLESKKIVNNSEKIQYINCRITQILLHEIQHINQMRSNSSFYKSCDKREMILKKENKYDKKKYLSNPLERSAEISSSIIIYDTLKNIKEKKLCEIFKNILNKKLLSGYYTDKYEYPLNNFFDKKIPIIDINNDNIVIGDIITQEELNNIINDISKIRR